jgi:catechol 2,3-dioxygenase-like lactoylglutathione lyase family enzyme
MSYFALATNSFDAVVQFYGEDLCLPVVAQWDRPNGRGRRFDLGGVLLEILDNKRERSALRLCEPADRFHVVVEVRDIEATRTQLPIPTPAPQTTTWGATLFQLRDPDGVIVTFLEWENPRSSQT